MVCFYNKHNYSKKDDTETNKIHFDEAIYIYWSHISVSVCFVRCHTSRCDHLGQNINIPHTRTSLGPQLNIENRRISFKTDFKTIHNHYNRII